MNNILMIRLYNIYGVWAFDDPAVGLSREPFVCGMGEIIDNIVEHLPDAKKGFNLFFSSAPFVGSQGCLKRLYPESGGNWYMDYESGLKGWLCPAMYKYFEDAPNTIYYKAE